MKIQIEREIHDYLLIFAGERLNEFGRRFGGDVTGKVIDYGHRYVMEQAVLEKLLKQSEATNAGNS